MAIINLRRNYTIQPPLGVVPDFGHPLARGLVAGYLFNEGGGSGLYNLVRGAGNGTLSGATWANKQRGSSVNLGGSPQYVDLGNPSGLNFGDGVPYSFEWIFRMSVAGANNQQLMSKDDVTGNQRIHFFVNGGVLIRWTDLNGPTVNTNWIHVVYTYTPGTSANNGTEVFYANGFQVSTRTGAVPAWQTSPSYALGRSTNGGIPVFHMQGDIALCRVYKVALTQNEILGLYVNPYAPLKYSQRFAADPVAPVVPSCDSWLPAIQQPYIEPFEITPY